MKPATTASDGFHLISAAPGRWVDCTSDHKFVDITYKLAPDDGTARIAINRPQVHNAFRPTTVSSKLQCVSNMIFPSRSASYNFLLEAMNEAMLYVAACIALSLTAPLHC
jgi:hypothetical protein